MAHYGEELNTASMPPNGALNSRVQVNPASGVCTVTVASSSPLASIAVPSVTGKVGAPDRRSKKVPLAAPLLASTVAMPPWQWLTSHAGAAATLTEINGWMKSSEPDLHIMAWYARIHTPC